MLKELTSFTTVTPTRPQSKGQCCSSCYLVLQVVSHGVTQFTVKHDVLSCLFDCPEASSFYHQSIVHSLLSKDEKMKKSRNQTIE